MIFITSEKVYKNVISFTEYWKAPIFGTKIVITVLENLENNEKINYDFPIDIKYKLLSTEQAKKIDKLKKYL